MSSKTLSYRLNDRAVYRLVDDEAVILDLDKGLYYGLNAVGARIWQLIGANLPASRVCEAIVEEFEVSAEEALADVDAFLESLLSNGLITLG